MPFLDQISPPFLIERCQRDGWNIFKGTHFHDCYELYYLEDGEITYFVDEDIYTVQKGNFILIPPGVIHKTLPYHRQAHTRILIYLKPEFLRDFLAEDPALLDCFARPLVTMAGKGTAERLLFGLLDEAERGAHPVMLRAMTGELLVWLNRWAVQEADMPSAAPRISAGVNEKVLEAVRFLNAHYMEDISLSKLAARFYMNPTYLSRIFRKVMGVSYSEYLIRVRIRQALRLLNDTDKKITEIAQETGFHSDNHFCKMFRQVMGVSPLKYRTAAKGK